MATWASVVILAYFLIGCTTRALVSCYSVPVADAPTLVVEVDKFGTTGVDMEIVLTHNITIGATPFMPVSSFGLTDGPQPFSMGQLTLSASQPATVLDTSMQHDLIPQFQGLAELHLGVPDRPEAGFTLVNLCEQILPWNAARNLVYMTALNTAIFNRSRAYSSHSTANMRMYSRRADLAVYLYVQVTMRCSIPAFQAAVAHILEILPVLSATVARVTAHSAVFRYYKRPSAQHWNLTLLSVADLSDPLIASMRASGTLLPPQFCNGTLVPQPVADSEVDPRMGPVWVASNTTEWMQALGQVAAFSNASAQVLEWRPPATLMLSGVSAPTPLDLSPGPPRIVGSAMLMGAFNDVPEEAVPTLLDLGSSGTGAVLLTLSPGAELYITTLTLRGLEPCLLPSVPGSTALPSSPAINSSLPLWFVGTTEEADWLTRAPISLENVTLELPGDDYLSLLTLALAGGQSIDACAGAAVVQRAQLLRPGVTSITPEAVGPMYEWLQLAVYVGWRVNATRLRVAPIQQDAQAVAAVLAGCMQQEGGSSGNTTKIVVAVVVGMVGGLLVLMGAVLLVWHKRRSKSYRAPKDVEGSPPKEPADEGKEAMGRLTSKSSCLAWCITASAGSGGAASATSRRGSELVINVKHLDDNGEAATGSVQAGCPSNQTQHDLQSTVPLSSSTTQPSSGGSFARLAPLGLMQSSAGIGSSAMLHGHVQAKAEDQSSVQLSLWRVVATAERLVAVSRREVGIADLARAASRLDRHDDQKHSGAPAHAGSSQDSRSRRPSADDCLAVEALSLKGSINAAAAGLGHDADTVVVCGVLGQGSWGLVRRAEWRGLMVALKTLVFESDPGLSSHGNSGIPNPIDGDGPQAPPSGVLTHHRAIMEAAIAASVGHRNVVCTYHYDIKAVKAKDTADTKPGGLQITYGAGDPGPEMEPGDKLQSTSDAPRERQAYKMYLLQELCSTNLAVALRMSALHSGPQGLTDNHALMYVLLDIATGLEYLHARNIVHGDLKPANVLLKPDTGSPSKVVAKLADFGLSSMLQPGATHLSGFHSGTPFFVAPEVVQEWRTSPAADIYSFGVLMWKLYTGLLPWITTGPDNHYAQNPIYPQYPAPRVPPPAYAQLAARCVQRDPHARPTATEIIAQLPPALGLPYTAPPQDGLIMQPGRIYCARPNANFTAFP